MSALEIAALDAWYGRAQALFGISLTAAPGEVVALVGRNGAGKSTLLKSVMGLVAGRGRLAFAGRDIGTLAPHVRARSGIAYVAEERRIFTDLTVRENLQLAAQGRALELAPLLELFPNLAEMLDRSAAHMSGGEQQMLAVARALAARPKLVLLDEPSEGIAPKIVAALAAAVIAMRAQGVGVLLSEQNLHFVARVADRALLIEHGHVVGTATRDELATPSAAVREVLGL
jgi:branched-chain amino acid transport system ATP-binding protein